MVKQPGKRLTILSNSEIKDLYELPIFNSTERNTFFTLSALEMQEMESRNYIASRVYFILQLGYFKSKTIFFNFKFSQVREDVKYIIKRYFANTKIAKPQIAKNTRLNQQSSILELMNYRIFDHAIQKELTTHLLKESRICIDPRYIFDSVLDFLRTHQIILPGYSTLQDMIGQVLITEEQRLQSLITDHIATTTDQALQKMLWSEGKKMYGITILKKDAKGFNHREMEQEIQKKLVSAPLFEVAAQIIPKLAISEQNIRHYAYLVDYYTVNRLNELPYQTVRLYLLCYIFYRFEKINDNLVSSFIYHINAYKKAARQASKEKIYVQKTQHHSYGGKIGEILDLFIDEKLTDDMKFGEVRSKAFSLVEKEKFHLLKQHLITQTFEEEEFKWDYYKQISKTISRNLRPLVRAIDFAGEDIAHPLLEALAFLKHTFASKKSLRQIDAAKFPKQFIPAAIEPYLYEIQEKDGNFLRKLNVYQYEFLVYYQLERALDTGRVFVNNSFNFKSLKKDLYEPWETDKKQIITSLNNPVLQTPIKEQLNYLKQELNTLILQVNQRIAQGKNKEIKLKPGKDETGQKWTLAYSKKGAEINNPFYNQFPLVSLNQVMRLVNQHCHFMDEFTHVKARYSKTKADEDSIIACITANATNYGIFQMSAISDISYDKLLNTSNNFIRLETLKKGNEALINGMAELAIFKHWNLFDNLLISSSDGKKIHTRFKHIMARHSSKYFGQKRGVVSFSMILNNVCPGTKIISAHDHESHHFYDLNFHNSSDLQPDWSCGDTHSINRVNFALLHLLGQRFTPHIKDISHKARTIHSFENPAHYADYLICPGGRINEGLIEEEWNNIQHIFASLLMKQTTQSAVVRKLSSHERSSKMQKALWEYDKIFMSAHILRFIDDPNYRQAIRTALNRGEGYHQLTGKIASVNGSKFRGTTALELAIWNECSRFIANCIIYYNTLLLSKIYEMQEKQDNLQALEFIKRLSPIAWRHIILNGRYEFTSQSAGIDLERMIAVLIFNFDQILETT